jgi:hypothetical protein
MVLALIPWNRFLPEKLIVAQLVSDFTPNIVVEWLTRHLGGVVVSVLATGPQRLRVENLAKAVGF